MTPWKIPVVVAAIAVPVVAGFLLGGPAVGVALGALAALALLVVAARQRPRKPIGPVPVDSRRRVLVVIACVADADQAAERIRARLRLAPTGEAAEIQVLAPVHIGFLDRWASDVEGAREEAQRSLTSLVEALARAHIAAEARVGDEGIVQAVEDQLQTFPATEVLLVSGEDEDHGADADAVAELESRLLPEFDRIALPTSAPARFEE